MQYSVVSFGKKKERPLRNLEQSIKTLNHLQTKAAVACALYYYAQYR
jgi:hypothetical protein